ncbi:MAG: winged helix-turn-helix transcriptional regulator [Armatimonadetes bacterium]|nr:winged helix-turn-helix transcriptional regulator [Armatimonadota bacterium]
MNSQSTSAGLAFWRLHQRWTKQANRSLNPLGLNTTKAGVLLCIAKLEAGSSPVVQARVSEWTGLDPMVVSNTVRALSEVGLINQVSASHDLRAKVMTLTETGESLIPRIEEALRRANERSWSAEVNETLNGACESVLDEFSDRPAERLASRA